MQRTIQILTEHNRELRLPKEQASVKSARGVNRINTHPAFGKSIEPLNHHYSGNEHVDDSVDSIDLVMDDVEPKVLAERPNPNAAPGVSGIKEHPAPGMSDATQNFQEMLDNVVKSFTSSINALKQSLPDKSRKRDLEFPPLGSQPRARSYAERAAAPAKPRPFNRLAKVKRDVFKALAPREEPSEFDRVQFRINSSVLSKYTGKEKFSVARLILKKIGLDRQGQSRRKYVELSLIGNSVIEIYVPRGELETVRAAVRNAGLIVLESHPNHVPSFGKLSQDQANEAMISRLASLYKRASFIRLKECIVRGLDDETAEKIKRKARLSEDMEIDVELALQPGPQGAGSQ